MYLCRTCWEPMEFNDDAGGWVCTSPPSICDDYGVLYQPKDSVSYPCRACGYPMVYSKRNGGWICVEPEYICTDDGVLYQPPPPPDLPPLPKSFTVPPKLTQTSRPNKPYEGIQLGKGVPLIPPDTAPGIARPSITQKFHDALDSFLKDYGATPPVTPDIGTRLFGDQSPDNSGSEVDFDPAQEGEDNTKYFLGYPITFGSSQTLDSQTSPTKQLSDYFHQSNEPSGEEATPVEPQEDVKKPLTFTDLLKAFWDGFWNG